jgi:hypothetical protein
MSSPTERPILMSAPMVRALLNGTKTQTRRIVNITPPAFGACLGDIEGHPKYEDEWFYWYDGGSKGSSFTCPYGKPGDRLWVKETFYAYGYWTKTFDTEEGRDVWHFNDETNKHGETYRYFDNAPLRSALRTRKSLQLGWYKRPAIFMPRDVSRLTLEVTEVRVQRLQEISEADAIAEGVERWVVGDGWREYGLSPEDEAVVNAPMPTARESYRTLWDSINGPGSWDANDWVWAVTFKVVQP